MVNKQQKDTFYLINEAGTIVDWLSLSTTEKPIDNPHRAKDGNVAYKEPIDFAKYYWSGNRGCRIFHLVETL